MRADAEICADAEIRADAQMRALWLYGNQALFWFFH